LPLSEKLRVEFFLPDSPEPAYAQLIHELEIELTYTFSGSSTIQGIKGLFESEGKITQDRIHLVFTDVPLNQTVNREVVETYVDVLQKIIFAALNEESVLIAVHPIFHQTG